MISVIRKYNARIWRRPSHLRPGTEVTYLRPPCSSCHHFGAFTGWFGSLPFILCSIRFFPPYGNVNIYPPLTCSLSPVSPAPASLFSSFFFSPGYPTSLHPAPKSQPFFFSFSPSRLWTLAFDLTLWWPRTPTLLV